MDQVCYQYTLLALIMGETQQDRSSGRLDCDRLATWVTYFSNPDYAISALSQAALLADHAALLSARGRETLKIYGEKSTDFTQFGMPTTSMVAPSILYAIYHFVLIFLCCLGAVSVHWTRSLDSHAMVMITAALCDTPDTSVAKELTEKEELMDTLSEYVGGAEPDFPVGRFAVGADATLRWKRRYWKGKGLAL